MARTPYVFRTLHAFGFPWTAQERKLSDTLSAYWLNFARTGDPDGPGLSKWPRYSEGQVVELSAEPHAAPLPRAESLKFMDALFTRERESGGDNLER